MPDTRPRVVFNADGVCNACSFHATKSAVDWDERKRAFIDLARSMKRHPAYDCIVPFSGGKDSAVIAWRLKNELGLKPLLVTYGQMIWTPAGKHNFNAVCDRGFDILYWRHDQEVSRKLAKRFLIERGHPKAHYDAGINAVPVIAAKSLGIPLIVYAEHGESEYGGRVLSERHRMERDLEEVLENCVGDDARNWAVDWISEASLYPYIYPDDVTGLKAVYFSWFFPWDIYANARLAFDRLDFRPAHIERTPDGAHWRWGRSDGSFEGFDSIDDAIDDLDFCLMHRKFGFGRATRMASRLIQNGHMTRDDGLKWVEKYDGEFPSVFLPDILRYLGMERTELERIVDLHTGVGRGIANEFTERA